MERMQGSRLKKKAPLLKGEAVVLRLEVHTNAFGGWNAWLWANIPGEGPVAYSITARGWVSDGIPDVEAATDAIERRLRELLPFILI